MNTEKYLKTLIEAGGAYVVDDEGMINLNDGSPVTVVSRKEKKPIQLYREVGGGIAEDWVVLNPLSEQLGMGPECKWFYQTRSIMVGSLTKRILKAIIERVVASSEDDYALEDVAELAKFIDDSSMSKVDKIKPIMMANIFYDRKPREAILQTHIIDSDYKELKIRKKDWDLITQFIEMVFGDMGSITHKSKNIAIQRFECMIGVYTKALEALSRWVEQFVPDKKYDVGYLIREFDQIEKHRKNAAWYNTRSETEMEDDTPPWEDKPSPENTTAYPNMQTVQQAQQPAPAPPQQQQVQQYPHQQVQTQAPSGGDNDTVEYVPGAPTGSSSAITTDADRQRMYGGPMYQQQMYQQPGMVYQQPAMQAAPAYQQQGMQPQPMYQQPYQQPMYQQPHVVGGFQANGPATASISM